MSIYARLFRYRQTENLSPKENFLTEALADLFNRLPADKQADFLVDAIHPLWEKEVRTRCGRARTVLAQTQVSIVVDGSVKRPDMLISLDDQPFVVFEIKVDAELQRHAVNIEDGPAVDLTPFDRDQLATYGLWIAAQGRDGWPGAVVFITHSTRAPKGFGADGRAGPIEMAHSWRELGKWLADNLDFDKYTDTSCALAADLYDFLSEENLMPEFMTAQDLAATAVFLPSAANVRHTFETALGEVLRLYPGIRSGSSKLEPWPQGNAYLGWFYLSRSVNVRGSRFTLSIGVCFGGGSALGDEVSDALPRHEPFFVVHLGDDNERVPVTDILRAVPNGWMLINEEWSAIVLRTVSSFPADPDLRAEALIAWSTTEVGNMLAQIPNYRGGVAEGEATDED